MADTIKQIFEAYERKTGESIFDLAAKTRTEQIDEAEMDEDDIAWNEAQKIADAERAARSHGNNNK